MIETVEQYIARGGKITICPRAFAQEGHTPQSPYLTAAEADALMQHYDDLERKYCDKWRRVKTTWYSNHLFTRLNNEHIRESITEEAV